MKKLSLVGSLGMLALGASLTASSGCGATRGGRIAELNAVGLHVYPESEGTSGSNVR